MVPGSYRDGVGHTAISVTGLPAPGLRPFVRSYQAYDLRGFAPGVHIGLPGPYLTVVISLAAPTLVSLDSAAAPQGFAALASGLFAGPAFLPHDGNQTGVQLDLTPAGARALLGVPAGELAGLCVDLRDLLGPAGRDLPSQLADLATWPERFALLDRVLGCQSEGDPAPTETLTRAYRRILASAGTLPIASLADELGWSRRHLSARFTAEYGIGPKEAARVARFARSRELLVGHGRLSLARIAADCGYSDQAHLAREWRDLAGCSPSAWLAGEEFPIVQVGGREASVASSV